MEEVVSRWRESLAEARARGKMVRVVGKDSKGWLPWCRRGADEVVFSMQDWQGVVRYEPSELFVTVRAGTDVAEVEEMLAERGQWLGFEPPPGSVGGATASGWSGPGAWRYGSLRGAVLGVRLLDGAGRLLRFGGEVIKNVAGFDVARLVVGSWGRLGAIVEVTWRVWPKPAAVRTLCFEMGEGEALAFADRLRPRALPLSAFFWSNGRLWLRLAGGERAVAHGREEVGGEEVEEEMAAALWRQVRALDGEPWRAVPEGMALWRLAVPPGTPPLGMGKILACERGGTVRWVLVPAGEEGVWKRAEEVGGWAWRWTGEGPWQQRRQGAVGEIEERLQAVFDPEGRLSGGPWGREE
ncbi:MAG: glycolate oxidase subunit GlcE [Hydrogenophilus sp.]|nr:glycolate oxidase subunit GlcE [Hydrogenophilus sp.]